MQGLEILKNYQMLPNLKKCEFAQQSLVYLGYVIGGWELDIVSTRMDVIIKWLVPNNVIEVMIFIGAS
jgi:hypothetical protein